MSQTVYSALYSYYIFLVVQELPNWLLFLILRILPGATDKANSSLCFIFRRETPASDDALHASRKDIVASSSYRENWACMFPKCQIRLRLFDDIGCVPQLNETIFWDRNQDWLVRMEVDIPYSIAMSNECATVFVLYCWLNWLSCFVRRQHFDLFSELI